ncbi:MAG: hypothetical protein FJ087_19930, partial [Deltaproteobacteria bacterium]|nr:hypothetical protein [Deltaproteobacteria bacterium]
MEPFEFLDRYLAQFRKHLARETLLEFVGILMISGFSIFAVGVALVALTPGVTAVRVVAAVAGLGALAAGLRLGLRTRRVLADPERVARLLAERVPGLGLGLAAVVSLRPRLAVEGASDFSPALLHAEAMRDP